MDVRATVGSKISPRLRATVRSSMTTALQPTSRYRLTPAFLIIGGQRCGTTSLYRYLLKHPAIAPVRLTKGVHYFDVQFHRSWKWYLSHFPTRQQQQYVRYRHGVELLTGEASPYYIFHPLVPRRIAAALPEAKLIVLLRDPVERAYSHYQHEVARGFENLSFEGALAQEPERLRGEVERMEHDPTYVSFEHQHHSYLARGYYADQLERVFAVYPREQVLVVQSEHLFSRTKTILDEVHAFLGLSDSDLETSKRYNAHVYSGMSTDTRQDLVHHYASHNKRLYALVDQEYGWSEPPRTPGLGGCRQ